MHFLRYFILLSLISLSCSELLMVLEVFRHGAREPLDDYWNAKEFSHWGELTSVGMRQHYNLGRFLRKIYMKDLNFLSKKYDPNEIYIRSTDYNRTIQSAQSQLYGLYPLGSGFQIPKKLKPMLENPPFMKKYLVKKHHKNALPKAFQPIPIHTFPRKDDHLLNVEGNNCPVIETFKEEVKNSEFFKRLSESFENMIPKVGKLVDLNDEEINSLEIGDIQNIYDVFLCDLYADKPLPKNISEELWKNITLISNLVEIYTLTGIKEHLQFYVTPFFDEILHSFTAKLNGTEKILKWKMFSGHDTNMIVFLGGLNITNYLCVEEKIVNGETNFLNCALQPEFASNLIIELHQEKQEAYVKVRYDGYYVYLCEKKSTKCKFDEFRRRLEAFRVDYEKICKMGGDDEKSSFLNFRHFEEEKKN